MMSEQNHFVDPVVVNVISTGSKHVKKFGLLGTETTFKFTTPPNGVNEIDWIHKGLTHIVDQIKKNCSDTDFLGFTLKSLNLKHKDPGYIAFRPASEVSDDILWDIFGGILQSNAESVKSTDTFTVECNRVRINPVQINENVNSTPYNDPVDTSSSIPSE